MMSMGGYGMYVWPAYGITLLVFGINFFAALAEKKQIKKMIEEHES